MILQLLIVLFITVNLSSKIACKRFSPLDENMVEAEQRTNPRRYTCPIGSAVKGIDFEEKKVYCEKHDKSISDERSRKLCEWRKRCSFISKNRKASRNGKLKSIDGQDNSSRIARGLRFGVGRAINIARTSELLCCLSNCATNRCKLFKFSRERYFVGPKQKQNWFLNFMDWKPWLKRIYTGYCRARCNAPSKETECKSDYANLLDLKKASRPASGRFVCPIGTAVRAIDLKCRNVYCIEYKERQTKRTRKNCSWKRKCNTIKESKRTTQNTDKVKIARALRFHLYREEDDIKDIQLLCCTEKCRNVTCKYEEGEGSILDTDSESEAFLNFGTQRTRQQTKRGQYCESSCAAVVAPLDLTEILAISQPCGQFLDDCTQPADCCSRLCLFGRCYECFGPMDPCNYNQECCSKSCIGGLCE